MIEKGFEKYLDDKYPSVINKFTKKLPLPPIVTLAFISSFIYALHIVTCLVCGEYEQLVNDWFTLLGAFTGFYLLVVYLYLEKTVKNYSTILGQLAELKEETYQNFYEKFILLALRSRNVVLCYLSIFILANIVLILRGLWYDSFLANFWLLIELNVILVGGALNLWLMVCTSRMLYMIGDKPIRINPFHHDEMGGLKAFGTLSFLFFICATVGATLLAIILFFAPWKNSGVIINYYGSTVLIAAYSAVLISFFIPLLTAHKTLKNFKEKKLSTIDESLMICLDEIEKKTSSNSDSGYVKDKLEEIIYFQDNINKMKTWPFGYIIIIQVVGSTTIPLASLLTKIGVSTTALLLAIRSSIWVT